MFKERFQQALNERGIKPIELSEKLGIPKSTISNYLSGRMEPKHDRLTQIAKALDVQETWLMGYDVEMDRPVTKEQLRSEIDRMFSMLNSEDQTIVKSLILSLIEKRSS